MASDYYAILGVDRDASQAEIKRRYREIARLHHPDKNPGDAVSEGIFKDAAEAYRVLGDPDLRAEYDRLDIQHAASRPPGDVFEELFGGVRRPTPRPTPKATSRGPSPERGADLRYSLEISLTEAVSGTRKSIVVPKTERCPHCAGTGAEPGSVPILCADCGGTGTTKTQRGFFDSVSRCERCGGAGKRIPNDCRVCRGRGRTRLERRVEIGVPGGVEEGTRLKLSGEGEVGQHGGPPGDLFVVISIQPHALFVREGADLLVDVPVPLSAAVLGGEIEVPTLEGVIRMKLPEGTQHGRIFRLKGKGFPLPDAVTRGDERVRVVVEFPELLSPELRELFERLAELEAWSPKPPRTATYERLLAELYPNGEPEH